MGMSGSNDKYRNNGNNNRASAYVGAPYNFVPFAGKVIPDYESADQLPAHNRVSETLLSGDITFTLSAQTPVFVGNGDGNEFYRTVTGAFAIPGSSIKGLIRNNMQILGMGSIADDVEDYYIMYRAVGNARSVRTDDYKEILGVKTIQLPGKGQITLPTNVQAGYICERDGHYYIKETVTGPFSRTYGKLNYYSLSEKTILDDKEKKWFKLDNDKLQNKFFYQEENKNTGKKEWKGKINNEYYPYCIPVYYKANNRTASSVYKASGGTSKPNGYQEGYLLSTGAMSKKKHVYIISAMKQDGKEIKIDDADILAYKRDYELKKNVLHGTRLKDTEKIKAARAFYLLPEEGQSRPVFYIRENGRVYFGYTPYLRIFYENSTMKGVPEEHRDAEHPKMDYVRSILGFSVQEDSYKSRVSFEDAPLKGNGGDSCEGPEIGVTLGEPKLSSYPDYLRQENDGEESTYNDRSFSFRGIKQYWLHQGAEAGTRKNADKPEREVNDKVSSKFRALKAGSSFDASIHFRNLRKAELGLLLWCIYQGENYQWNIGKAKSYGYGRMSLSRPVVRLYDPAKMYSGNLTLDVYRSEPADVDMLIRTYQSELKKRCGLNESSDVEKLPGIREFLSMKDCTRMPDANRIRYMSIDAKEYQNRSRALPTVEELLAGKEGKELRGAASTKTRPSGKAFGGNRNEKKPYGRPKQDAEGAAGYREALSRINAGNGEETEAEFIRFDSRKNEMTVKINGREVQIPTNKFKAMEYSTYQKNRKLKVKVEVRGKKTFYELPG